MIGEPLVFTGSAAVPLAIMALVFALTFAWFVLDCSGTSDRYDGKAAAWLGVGFAAFTAGASAAVAVVG
jgi:hypothetical protein